MLLNFLEKMQAIIPTQIVPMKSQKPIECPPIRVYGISFLTMGSAPGSDSNIQSINSPQPP